MATIDLTRIDRARDLLVETERAAANPWAALGAAALAATAAIAMAGVMILGPGFALDDPAAPIRIAAQMLGRRRTDEPLLPMAQAMLDQRTEALAQIGVVRHAALVRVEELQRQRTANNQELEFYKKDLDKAPPAVRRQMEEVSHSLAIQSRFIAEQDAELQRVNARFDEELARLKPLWTSQSPQPPAAASSAR